jgi:hypothetical protein
MSLEERLKHLPTKEELEAEKQEINEINRPAQSRVALENALTTITSKHSKPMMALKAIVYAGKTSKAIDQKTDKLVHEYWNSNELKNIFMRQTLLRDQSKESWLAFKEEVRSAIGKEKLKFLQEKKGGDFMVFPHDSTSESESESSDDDAGAMSPRSPAIRKLVEKFETPPTSRSGTQSRKPPPHAASAAAAKPKESDSEASDSDGSFIPDFDGDEEGDQSSADEMKFVLQRSKEAVKESKHGKLSIKEQYTFD